MKKTNFDLFLEEKLRDPKLAERFKQAGEAWDLAPQIARRVIRLISRRSTSVAAIRATISQRLAMTFDLQKILERKEARRRDLASRPVAEKLRMLDALRERELAIRGNSRSSEATIVREEPEQRRTSSL